MQTLQHSTSTDDPSRPRVVLCLHEATLNNTQNNQIIYRAFKQVSKEVFHKVSPTDITSPFRALQRGAESLASPRYWLFCVLLDTTPKVTKSTPAAKFDSSQKVSPPPTQLSELIYSIMTFDAFAEQDHEELDA